MRPQVIGVTGYKNSGKNAVCNVLRDEFGYDITGFADILKSMALAIDPIIYMLNDGIYEDAVRLSEVVKDLGWDVAKERHVEVRRLLQRLGTEGVRDHLGQNAWVDAWWFNANGLLQAGHCLCVSDVRFLNEADAIRDLNGVVWRVHRPGTGPTAHASETELDLIEADFVIRNDTSLEGLAAQVQNLLVL